MSLHSNQRVDSLEGAVIGGDALVEEQLRRLGRVREDRDAGVVAGGFDGEGDEGATMKEDVIAQGGAEGTALCEPHGRKP